MKNKKLIANLVSTFFLQAIILLSGFVVKKIIIQVYGSEINGLVTSITQFLSYVTLLESGIGPIIKATLYKPLSKKNNNEITNILYASDKFFRKIALIFIIYIGILSVVYPIIVINEFSFLFTMSLVIIIALSTFFEYYFGMTYKLLLQSDQKIYIVSFIQIIVYLLNLILTLILSYFKISVIILKLVVSIVYVIRPILQNYYVRKIYKINYDNCDKNYVLQHKWDGLAQHIAAVVHSSVDVTVLTIFSSLNNVSIYSVYSTITNGLRQIVQIFNDAIESFFGKIIADDLDKELSTKFDNYETFFYSLITILYTCALILITPFIHVYTISINDTNYCRQVFGYFLVLGELLWAMRQPYNNLIKASGHFKQTKNGAIIEAILNVVLSIILVSKYNLLGVAIGTFVAMLYRTIEFIYYTNKYILNRNILESLKKIFLMVVEIIIVFFITRFINFYNFSSYYNWFINAIIIFVISLFVTLIMNIMFFGKKFKQVLFILKKKRGN